MNPANSPFGKASQFFGAAFNDLAQASNMQTKMQGRGFADAQYDSEYDDSYMEGDVAPQTGTFGAEQGPVDNVESVKEDLLSAAKEKNRPTNGSVSLRVGGGINYAVRS